MDFFSTFFLRWRVNLSIFQFKPKKKSLYRVGFCLEWQWKQYFWVTVTSPESTLIPRNKEMKLYYFLCGPNISNNMKRIRWRVSDILQKYGLIFPFNEIFSRSCRMITKGDSLTYVCKTMYVKLSMFNQNVLQNVTRINASFVTRRAHLANSRMVI